MIYYIITGTVGSSQGGRVYWANQKWVDKEIYAKRFARERIAERTAAALDGIEDATIRNVYDIVAVQRGEG